jgi:hypothetical protein
MTRETDDIKQDIKNNISEIIGGFCIMLLILALLFFKRLSPTPILITVLGCVAIGLIAVEKRAERFDRIFSSLVILVLAFGFLAYG